MGEFGLAYLITGMLCGVGYQNGPLPVLCSFVLVALSIPTLRKSYRYYSHYLDSIAESNLTTPTTSSSNSNSNSITKKGGYRSSYYSLLFYCILVMVLGVGFESVAVMRGGFGHTTCPSLACLGQLANVPVVWLPFLYLHVALLVHKLLVDIDIDLDIDRKKQ